jgi:hypothetical protein
VIQIGKPPISLDLGYRYYAETPENGLMWRLRFCIKFLF